MITLSSLKVFADFGGPISKEHPTTYRRSQPLMASHAFADAAVCHRRLEDIDIFSNTSISNFLFPLKTSALIVRPIIGTTSQIIRSSKWYKDVGGLGVNAVEINRRYSKLHLNAYFLEKVNRYLQNMELSLHSATTGVFQELESFTQAELKILQAEVDVARLLGADEVVFHLNGGALHGRNKERLARVIDYAKARGVNLIYESDSALQADLTCNVLETFADIDYALDLGHLNYGHCRNMLGCEIDDFISRVRDRTVYIHANNNCGTRDEHKGLNDGTLDWRRVFSLLDIGRIKKIIIEVRAIEYFQDTLDELRNYLTGTLRNPDHVARRAV
jgi:sugar phosphate isomerase/epimerase